jgi:hypothetical protein
VGSYLFTIPKAVLNNTTGVKTLNSSVADVDPVIVADVPQNKLP